MVQSCIMKRAEVRQKYLDFFKARGHTIVPSASLIPENDATTLFTSAGMQSMIPFLLGQPHPGGKRVADSQKCFRSQDIEEIGDNRHTTFFEMLGNWSFGDYYKKEQLSWIFDFLIHEIHLDPKKIYVTVFGGNDQIPRDTESVALWKELFKKEGIEARDLEHSAMNGVQDGRIFYYGNTKNWWSRSGTPSQMPTGEPGGPSSEIFYEFTDIQHRESYGPVCHVNCDCGHFLEIGNNVFMEYIKQSDGSFGTLPQKNIDFGGGLERIVAASEDQSDIFRTDAFHALTEKITTITGKLYPDHRRAFQIITDHVRASVMLINDGVVPSNKTQGYIVRRLLRRAIRYGLELGIRDFFLSNIADQFITLEAAAFPELQANRHMIIDILDGEEAKFQKTIQKGLKEIEKLPHLDGTIAFKLYETFGFPFELTEEIARDRGQHVEYGEFRKEFEKHQETSRTTSAGSFKGGLADHSDIVIRYHTATHLLHTALRTILGDHVIQRGSNITNERTRFDFSHPHKMTPEQIESVENLVNQWIGRQLTVKRDIMPLDEAKKIALGAFGEKYSDPASVYTILDPITHEIISREFCGGPHVENTGSIGHIKIIKEEAISAGIRRIKAIIEPRQ